MSSLYSQEQFNGLGLAVKLPHLVSSLRLPGATAEVCSLTLSLPPSLSPSPSPSLPPPQVKTMAAVLLRRVFLQLEFKDLVEGVDAGVLRQCQAELLQAVTSEPLAHVRRKIGDAIAEMARSSIG